MLVWQVDALGIGVEELFFAGHCEDWRQTQDVLVASEKSLLRSNAEGNNR